LAPSLHSSTFSTAGAQLPRAGGSRSWLAPAGERSRLAPAAVSLTDIVFETPASGFNRMAVVGRLREWWPSVDVRAGGAANGDFESTT
jgi:hypothetical protein